MSPLASEASSKPAGARRDEPMPVIKPGDFSNERVRALLARHLEGMHANSPPGHVFALDWSGLQKPEISFYALWEHDVLLGIGALKELDPRGGEIKSMRTADAHLRRGVAATILEHIIAEARQRGYARLSLETGSGQAFEPAVRLYRKYGFTAGGAFDGYKRVPSINSCILTWYRPAGRGRNHPRVTPHCRGPSVERGGLVLTTSWPSSLNRHVAQDAPLLLRGIPGAALDEIPAALARAPDHQISDAVPVVVARRRLVAKNTPLPQTTWRRPWSGARTSRRRSVATQRSRQPGRGWDHSGRGPGYRRGLPNCLEKTSPLRLVFTHHCPSRGLQTARSAAPSPS